MNIVVLDGYALNPGDMSWEALRNLGEVTIYDRTKSSEILKRAAGAQVIITNKTPLTAKTLTALPDLRYIGVLATGYNIVDVAAAAEKKIPVTNIPSYGTASVAQMVFAHILHITQHVAEHAKSVTDGKWAESIDYCYWDYPLIELSGLTMGIIGYGRIGQATAALARAFGMKVIACTGHTKEDPTPSGDTFVGIDEVFTSSDVVTLHCPLIPSTIGIVSAERISMMKHTAYLINTSRGALVDEQALADALNHGIIAGAGLDVVETEPITHNNPLATAKNCFITPHIAWATLSARKRLLTTAVENIHAWSNGNPRNVVNQ